MDLYGQRAVYFEEIEMVVLDEADRMLDMGFIESINKIIDCLPSEVQFLLFSATLSRKVRELAKPQYAIRMKSVSPPTKPQKQY